MENFDVNRFLTVFAEILSDEFGVQITMTATPKNQNGGGMDEQ